MLHPFPETALVARAAGVIEGREMELGP